MESKRAEQIINENVAKFINRDEDYKHSNILLQEFYNICRFGNVSEAQRIFLTEIANAMKLSNVPLQDKVDLYLCILKRNEASNSLEMLPYPKLFDPSILFGWNESFQSIQFPTPAQDALTIFKAIIRNDCYSTPLLDAFKLTEEEMNTVETFVKEVAIKEIESFFSNNLAYLEKLWNEDGEVKKQEDGNTRSVIHLLVGNSLFETRSKEWFKDISVDLMARVSQYGTKLVEHSKISARLLNKLYIKDATSLVPKDLSGRISILTEHVNIVDTLWNMLLKLKFITEKDSFESWLQTNTELVNQLLISIARSKSFSKNIPDHLKSVIWDSTIWIFLRSIENEVECPHHDDDDDDDADHEHEIHDYSFASLSANNYFAESIQRINLLHVSNVFHSQVSLSIRFQDEPAAGSGVLISWLSRIWDELLKPELNLFSSLPNDSGTPIYFLNPLNKLHLPNGIKEPSELFDFLRHFFELALSNSFNLGVIVSQGVFDLLFDREIFARDSDEEIYYDIVREFDPEFMRNLLKIENMDDDEFDDPQSYISKQIQEKFNDHPFFHTHEAWEDVCGEDIEPWSTIDIPSRFYQRFLCAAKPIDIEDWKKNSVMTPLLEEKTKWFWDWVENHADNQQRKLLLQFVTGRKHPPANGFAGLTPLFCVGFAPHYSIKSLPTSQTCFNTLRCPLYPTFAQFKSKLEIALSFSEVENLSNV
jgi:hypothetical protein